MQQACPATEWPALGATTGIAPSNCYRTDRRECARSPRLPCHSACCRLPALTALWPQDRSSGLHGAALPGIDFRNRASSDFPSDIVPGSGSTDFVEDLVTLQTEVAGDDFFLDLGGAAEGWIAKRLIPDDGATGDQGSHNMAPQPRTRRHCTCDLP